MTWLDRCVKRVYTEMVLEIKNILDNIWAEIVFHAVNLNSIKDLFDINDHTFIVWDANNNSDTWKVYYFDDKQPECEFDIFISSKVFFDSIISLFYLNFIY